MSWGGFSADLASSSVAGRTTRAVAERPRSFVVGDIVSVVPIRSASQRVSSALSSLVGVSLGEILGHASTILPSAPTRKAERMMPM